MIQDTDNRWRIWDDNKAYGEVFRKRAAGEEAEMESSKATAKQLGEILTEDKSVLDVGCGAGHYYRSLKNIFPFDFSYTGIDSTEHYITLAKQTFASDSNTSFLVGDIFNLPAEDRVYDVTYCANVLLHLPSIRKPMQELWRVTDDFLLVRTLVGKASFRIQQLQEFDESHKEEYDTLAASGEDISFFDNGEPRQFHYYNIYSHQYVQWLCSTLPDVDRVEILEDNDFNVDAFGADAWPDKDKPKDLTETMNGMQVNNYILQPWAFIKIWRKK